VTDDRGGRRIEGVILDVDGTLVDSNRLHAQAWFDAFREAGLDGGTVLDIQRLIGMGSDKLLPEAVGIEAESAEGRELTERRAALFDSLYLPTVRPIPGARALVEALRDRGHRLAVASSARPDELRRLLDVAGVGWLREAATSADEVEESKPEPDVVLAALRELDLPAERVALIGDTPYDVEAGTRAGVTVIGVRSGGWDETGLRGATEVYRDAADLVARLDQSPLGGGDLGSDGS
jgi:HAD superfamily hydrolase (TIGR01509 family)